MGHYKAVRLHIKELKQDNDKLRHFVANYHELSKRNNVEIMFWRGRAKELERKLQKLQNAFENGKTVSFSYDSNGYVVIDYGDIEEWKEYADRDKVDRVFYGKVVVE